MSQPFIPIVTASTAVALASLQIVLMLMASSTRTRLLTGLGDGGNDLLLRRIRMHGNLTENAPIFLILLGLVEWSGDWGRIVPAIAVAFVLLRIAHAIGLALTSGPSIPRIAGAAGTAVSVVTLAVLLTISVAGRL